MKVNFPNLIPNRSEVSSRFLQHLIRLKEEGLRETITRVAVSDVKVEVSWIKFNVKTTDCRLCCI